MPAYRPLSFVGNNLRLPPNPAAARRLLQSGEGALYQPLPSVGTPAGDQLPDLSLTDFEQAEFEQRKQQPDTQGILGFLPSLWDLLNMLGAGEYAVSNFLTNAIRSARGEAEFDPLNSLAKGFRAGFTRSGIEDRKRFDDVLTELGWKAGPNWTVNSTAKMIAGFLGGVLLDPLTYTGLGAGVRSTKIGGRFVHELQREALEKLSISAGKKIPQKSLGSFFGASFSGWAKKAEKRLIKEMKDAGQWPAEWGAKLQAEQVIRKQLGMLTLPTGGMGLKEIKAFKEPEIVKKVLRVMGRDTSDKAVNEFLEKGYQKLVDVGGVRLGPLRVFSAKGNRYKNILPEAAEMTGWSLATTVTKGTPVTHALASAVFDNKTWNKLVREPLRNVMQPIFQKINKFHGMSGPVATATRRLDAAGFLGNEEAAVLIDSLIRVPSELSRTLKAGGQEWKVPLGTRRLRPKELKVVGRYLYGAMEQGLEGERLVRKMTEDILNRTPHDTMSKWLRELRLNPTDRQAADMAQVARQVQEALVSLAGREQDLTMLKGLQEQYFPRLFKKRVGEFKDDVKLAERMAAEGNDLSRPWWTLRRKLGGDWEQMRKAAEEGADDAVGILEDDLVKILQIRIGGSFAAAHQRDALKALSGMLATRFKHGKGAKYSPLALREFRQQYPELTAKVAQRAAHDLLPGLPVEQVERIRPIIQDLTIKTKTSVDHANRLLGALETELKSLTGLTDDNLTDFRNMFHDIVANQRSRLQTAGPGAEEVLNLMEGRFKQFDDLLNERLAQNIIRREKGQIELAGRSGFKIRHGKAWTELDQRGYDAARRGEQVELDKLSDVGLNEAVGAIVFGHAPQLGRMAERAIRQESHKTVANIQFMKTAVKAYKDASRAATKPEGPAWARMFQTGGQARDFAERRIEAITRKFDDWGGKPITAARAAEYELLNNEREALQRLVAQVPQVEGLKGLKAKTEALRAAGKDLAEAKRLAREAGAEKYLPTLIKDMAKGGNWESLGPAARQEILRLLRKSKPVEAITEFYRVAEEPTYQLVKAGKFTIPAPGQPGRELNLSWLGGDEFMRRSIAEIVEHKQKGLLGRMADGLDRFTDFWRKLVTSHLTPILPIPRPAFHIRNAVDLIVRTTMGWGPASLFNMKAHKYAMQLMRGDRSKTFLIRGLEKSFDEVAEEVLASGQRRLLSQRIGLRRGAAITDAFIPEKLRQLGALNTERIGAAMENYFPILGYFVSQLRGDSLSDTVERMGRFMFYYGNTSELDRRFFRLIFPFWGFEKQAMRLVGWYAMKRPRIFNYWPRIRDMAPISKDEEALLPEWVRDYPFAVVYPIANGVKVASMRNIFSVDILPDILPRSWNDVLQRVNPLFMTPIEMGLGTEAYFRRPIRKTKYLYRQLQSPAMKNTVGKWLEAREVNVDGKEYVAVNGNKWHMLRRLWFSRMFREFDEASSVLHGKLGADNFAGLLIGFKAMEIDYDRQWQFIAEDAQKAYREYRRAVNHGDTHRARQIIKEMSL